jgi:hypothetical protein
MLKSDTNFGIEKNTNDVDRWDDEGGFTGCSNKTEKRYASFPAEIALDNTAHETSTANFSTDGNVLRDRIRAHLISLSVADVPMTYGKLTRAMGLYAPGSIAKTTQALEATMVEDVENSVPFLASLVVSKVGQGNAAKGFFEQAQALGRGPSFGEDDRDYYLREFIGASAMLTAPD